MAFTALLDSNVLYPANLRDALLWMAKTTLFEVRWSERILEDMTRNLKANRPDLEPSRINRTVRIMKDAFEDAMVEAYEDLIPAMTNHPGDRHVLAAAVVGRADVIVTQNVRHFPPAACAPYGIDVQNPDEFLCYQWDLEPEYMTEALRQWADNLDNPPRTLTEALQSLQGLTPDFSTIVLDSGLV